MEYLEYIFVGAICIYVGLGVYLGIDVIRDLRAYRRSRRKELYRLAEKTGRERMCGIGRRS